MSQKYGNPFVVDDIYYNPDYDATTNQHFGFGEIKEDICHPSADETHSECLGGKDAFYWTALPAWIDSIPKNEYARHSTGLY